MFDRISVGDLVASSGEGADSPLLSQSRVLVTEIVCSSGSNKTKSVHCKKNSVVIKTTDWIKMDDMTAPISEAKASWSPPGGWLQYT